ncbi:cytochrome P450 [Streptomyces prunicolor]|uniref:Cytochrome P450 n=1 Tax=Streptomyces prunicolor TaxID=67348 RepID=A0ABU4F166_9ACTN|nr:cytochrome P450 [Streptomyces prunicolor]MDV7214333.1 cytochrome P450 [Streptomyces prunicolor]
MTVTESRAYPFATEKLDFDPLYAALRREQPLCRVQLPYGEPAWLATRYEDVKVVLGDPRFSRAAAVGRDQPRSRPYPAGAGAMISLDPPEHSRLRRLVAKAFTMRRIDQLRPRVQQIADGLVDTMLAEGPPTDLVHDFGLPLPIAVMCELLGVPFEDRGDFRRWADAYLSTSKFTREQVADSRAQLREYVSGLTAERRSEPQDDLLSALVAARDAEDRLSEEELLTMAETILVAGHETTATQIPNFVYLLLTNPDQLAALRADLDLVPRAVEELLRYIPAGAGSSQPRYALEDVELGGVTVRAGEPVVVDRSSANRDETVYTDPEELDLTRKEAPHIGFGHGAHHCLGAPLARMELQVTLHTLLTRLPGLRFADSADDVVWKSGVSTRGPERMPVTWDHV